MHLKIDQLGLAVLLATVSLVVLLTLGSRWLHYRAERKSLANRIVCRLCLHAFENGTPAELVACPHCAALNERS